MLTEGILMNVGDMQRKLARWAVQRLEDQDAGLFASRNDLRLHDLYHLLYDVEWLCCAYERVASNKGSRSAGCDGLTLSNFQQNLQDRLRELANELKTQHFQPHPVRRVYIPKANGKLRPLGIPSIRDRIVQEALRMILEPIFEVEFYRNSYGFRPNRSTTDALARITSSMTASTRYYWVIEGDISSYFDTINHEHLMVLLRRRVRDDKLLTLVWRFLKAGVMEDQLFKATDQGTPQGGIISPLLANVYLHELDQFMTRWTDLPRTAKERRREQGRGNFVHVRYADDFVVMTNGTRAEAEAMRDRIFEFLTRELKLTLAVEKTKITHVNDGFTFLGYELKRDIVGSGRWAPKPLIPSKALTKAKRMILRITCPSATNDSVHAKFLALNRYLRGWANYYRYGYNVSKVFGHLDHFAYQHMARWLARKHRCKVKKAMRDYHRRVDGVVTLGTDFISLWRSSSLGGIQPLLSRHIPNPYESSEPVLDREVVCGMEPDWIGNESRPGMADLRRQRLEHDQWTCQACGRRVSWAEAQTDHQRPVRRHRRAASAHRLDNLQTLCGPCHRAKTESDRQMESRMR